MVLLFLSLLNFPDFKIYIEAANSPSLHISLFFSNLWFKAIDANLSFWFAVKYSKINEFDTKELIFVYKWSILCIILGYHGRNSCSKGLSINKPK